jgi:geranylgeranyl pyrophosphate synthase
MFTRFQDYVEYLKPSLEQAFTSSLAGLLGDSVSHETDPKKRILTGGKKIRGSLLCLVTAALEGSVKAALPRAIAVELIQTATLIHDDFVDQHRLRRNLPALWTLEGARRAVLLGDIIFASAIHMMNELGREDGLIVSQAIAEVSRGAYHEPLNHSVLLEEMAAGRVDAALYEKIIYLKTGVLFGAACELGAVAAAADAEAQETWRRYGLRIGEAYQIADDLQEVERYLTTGATGENEMTSLAPALLFFLDDKRASLLRAFQPNPSSLAGELRENLQAAAVRMRGEVERRLQAAVSEIESDLPAGDYGRLTRRAPWDLIRMFNEAGLPASLP